MTHETSEVEPDARAGARQDPPPRKPRVLYVLTGGEPGGAQRYVYNLARRLRDEFAVAVCFGEGDWLAEKLEGSGNAVQRIPSLKRRGVSFFDGQALWDLHRLMRRERYDLVHTNMFKAGLLARLAAWVAGVPVVVHTGHGAVFYLDRRPGTVALAAAGIERLLGQITDCLICVCQSEADAMVRRGMARHSATRVVHNGVETDGHRIERSRSSTRAALGVGPSTPLVGAVGRLVEVKGMRYLIEAMPKVLAEHPHARLAIVGDGPLRSELEGLADLMGVAGHVRFVGHREDVPALLAGLDLFVLPSLHEGCPFVLLEAMHAGLPTIASNVGGVGELIADPAHGLLVEPRNSDALAEAIGRLLQDSSLRRRLGHAASARAHQLFTAETMASQTAAVYRDLL